MAKKKRKGISEPSSALDVLRRQHGLETGTPVYDNPVGVGRPTAMGRLEEQRKPGIRLGGPAMDVLRQTVQTEGATVPEGYIRRNGNLLQKG